MIMVIVTYLMFGLIHYFWSRVDEGWIDPLPGFVTFILAVVLWPVWFISYFRD